MALATRCPNCQAMFRVVSDQLKLRGGLVRCGSCRHVFDAIGSLSYIDEAALTATAATAETPAPALSPADSSAADAPLAPESHPASTTEERTARLDEGSASAEPAGERPRSLPEAVAARVGDAATSPTPAVDPLAVPTLLAPSVAEQEAASEAVAEADRRSRRKRARHDGGAEDADESERSAVDSGATARATATAEAADSADSADSVDTQESAAADAAFLRNAQRPRGFSVFFGGGSAVLAIVLLLQAAVLFRTELSTRWPQLRPALVQLCDVYGCSVGWPTRAELLAVVGTELQAIPGTDILELTAVVRNRASYTMALPAVEITLTDTNNRTLARKVFAPVDYLASSGEPSGRISEGLSAGGDYIVRISFEARGLNAAGFVVYPFYL